MLFDTKKSINSPHEAGLIRNDLLRSQTNWMVDTNYKEFIALEKTEPIVDPDTQISRIR